MAVFVSVVELLLQKVADPHIQKVLSSYGVQNQVELLMEEFKGIQCILKDADAKQEGFESVKYWVRGLTDVAYDAEDVIDTFLFKMSTLRGRGPVAYVRRYAFFPDEFTARHKFGLEMERIKNKIRTISESRLTYGIEDKFPGAGNSFAGLSPQNWRLTSPLAKEPDFVGFEEDLQALVSQLLDGSRRRCVVSVVGMGGLGKTTLAKNVYNNEHVKRHFDSCEWICISQEYDVRNLLLNIINRYKQFNKYLESMDLTYMDVFQLRHEISNCLKEKRYLIVLDDIWTNEAWDALKDAFPDSNYGSRVMLTTRNKEVALHADARSQPHELRFLTNEESWKLFCTKAFPGRYGDYPHDLEPLGTKHEKSWKLGSSSKKAFPGQYGDYPQDLEQLGREIVAKCHSLPLAIVVVGGLLAMKDPREWELVHENIRWLFVNGEDHISGTLWLSYKDLPYYLKPCFLYLCNFPKDYEFHTNDLVQMWAAEGLLQERGVGTLEEIGEHYLKELIGRSMVQVARRSYSGGIKSCRVHHLLRDLSISEAKEGKFLEVQGGIVNAAPSASTARRLAIHHNDISMYISSSRSTPHLRSVLIYTQSNEWLQRKQEKFLCAGFKLLRVLCLHGVRIRKLPKEIGELIHLRYIRCNNTDLKKLPSSIGNLPNLQTLIVASSNNIKVPSTIEKMQQLRHFQVMSNWDVSSNWGMIKGHPRLNRISSLQTLSGVMSGEWMKGCLAKLTNLRKLGICLDLEGAYDEVLYESIVKLDCLYSLLVGTVGVEYRNSGFLVPPLSHLRKLNKLCLKGKLEKLPEYTEFPANLSKLTLAYSRLEQDPLATLEKLKNLRILILLLWSYVGKEMSCAAQGFPQLESLHLEGLEQLEEWRVEEGAMPSLIHLKLSRCQQLMKLPEGLQYLPALTQLELINMPDEFKERLQEDGGKDWHKIQHIPSIDIRNL